MLIEASNGTDPGWAPVAIVHAGRTDTETDLIDEGPNWTLRFTSQGVELTGYHVTGPSWPPTTGATRCPPTWPTGWRPRGRRPAPDGRADRHPVRHRPQRRQRLIAATMAINHRIRPITMTTV